jgi:hypothetical protein
MEKMMLQADKLSKYLMRISILLEQTDFSILPKTYRDRIQIVAQKLKNTLDKLIDDINLENENQRQKRLDRP